MEKRFNSNEGIEYGAEKVIVLPNGLAIIGSGIKLPGRNMTWVGNNAGLYLFDFTNPWQNVTKFQFSSNYDQAVSIRFISSS